MYLSAVILAVILYQCGILNAFYIAEPFQKQGVILFKEQLHRHLGRLLADGLGLDEILVLSECTNHIFAHFIAGIVYDCYRCV